MPHVKWRLITFEHFWGVFGRLGVNYTLNTLRGSVARGYFPQANSRQFLFGVFSLFGPYFPPLERFPVVLHVVLTLFPVFSAFYPVLPPKYLYSPSSEV